MSPDKHSPSLPLPPPPPPPPPPPSLTCRPLLKFSIQNDEQEPDSLVRNLLITSGLLSPTFNDGNCLFSHFNQTVSITQEGPTCGLIALMMALYLLEVKQINLPEVVSKAKELGYTFNGEMYSALNLCRFVEHLAPQCFGIHVTNITDKSKWVQLIEHLSSGWPILIPYDADHNQQPCLANGHHAHWAVILGYSFHLIDSDREKINLTIWRKDSIANNLYHLAKTSDTDSFQQFCRLAFSESSNFYVYAKQGKSPKVRLFDFNTLLKSNCNLKSVNSELPRRVLLPNEGVQAGLSDQAILIKPKNVEVL